MENHRQLIRELVFDLKFTYKQVRAHLTEDHGLSPAGLSERSIRRFCEKHDIHRTAHKFTKEFRESAVIFEHELAGPSCGKKFIHGLLGARGIHIGLSTVGKTLKVVDPIGTARRYQGVARQTNPPIYRADYFGQKLHFDQNEKLAMFGCTHVVAIDGYSRFIVGHATMASKNNTTIYEDIYKPVVSTYGVWDALRLDGGNEFNVIEYAQHRYSKFRFDQGRRPCMRGKSLQNHVVERVWSEMNRLVNYPIKRILRDLWHYNDIDMDDDREKYLVSALTRNIAHLNMRRSVGGWNHRYIEGRGWPYLLRRQIGQSVGHRGMAPSQMPMGAEMVEQYIEEMSGSFQEFPRFGLNPFPSPAVEEEWWDRLHTEYPDPFAISKAAHSKRDIEVSNYYIKALNLAEEILMEA